MAHELDVVSTEFSEEAAMQSGDMVRIIVLNSIGNIQSHFQPLHFIALKVDCSRLSDLFLVRDKG